MFDHIKSILLLAYTDKAKREREHPFNSKYVEDFHHVLDIFQHLQFYTHMIYKERKKTYLKIVYFRFDFIASISNGYLCMCSHRSHTSKTMNAFHFKMDFVPYFSFYIFFFTYILHFHGLFSLHFIASHIIAVSIF